MILGVLLLVALTVSAEQWHKLSSPHFDVFTNAGERPGKATLQRMEQVRRIFVNVVNERGQPLPVSVYLFGSERDFRAFRQDKLSAGYYQSSPERDYIVLYDSGPETHRVLYHEYAHLVLQHSSVSLPRWLEEGIAEFYSTVDPVRDKLRIGSPVISHARMLGASDWLTPGQLASVTTNSAFYNERDKATLFYAQSWAMVHMLNLAPGWREYYPRFLGLMAEAMPPPSAFEQAFGRTWEQAGQALVGYVRNARFPVVEIDWDEEQAAATAGTTVLSTVETDLAKGELLMAIGNQTEAERHYQRVAAAHTESAEVETALGTLALSRNDRGEARRRLERAVQLGTREARTYFEYAMLLRESGAPKKDVIAHLERTVELNPQYAEAHFLLGEEELRRSRFDEAINHLRQATAILPRQSYFWHALALAYHGQGERELARRAAHRASDSAKTEAESAAAQAAIRLFEKAPQKTPARKPDVTTPQSWQNRKGDAIAEGKLTQIECRGAAARLHVVTAKGRLVLEASRPHEIPLRNAGAVRREFSCGPQPSVAVAIEYLGETREIVAIEFR